MFFAFDFNYFEYYTDYGFLATWRRNFPLALSLTYFVLIFIFLFFQQLSPLLFGRYYKYEFRVIPSVNNKIEIATIRNEPNSKQYFKAMKSTKYSWILIPLDDEIKTVTSCLLKNKLEYKCHLVKLAINTKPYLIQNTEDLSVKIYKNVCIQIDNPEEENKIRYKKEQKRKEDKTKRKRGKKNVNNSKRNTKKKKKQK